MQPKERATLAMCTTSQNTSEGGHNSGEDIHSYCALLINACFIFPWLDKSRSAVYTSVPVCISCTAPYHKSNRCSSTFLNASVCQVNITLPFCLFSDFDTSCVCVCVCVCVWSVCACMCVWSVCVCACMCVCVCAYACVCEVYVCRDLVLTREAAQHQCVPGNNWGSKCQTAAAHVLLMGEVLVGLRVLTALPWDMVQHHLTSTQAPQCFTGLAWLSWRLLETLLCFCVCVCVCVLIVFKNLGNCYSKICGDEFELTQLLENFFFQHQINWE